MKIVARAVNVLQLSLAALCMLARESAWPQVPYASTYRPANGSFAIVGATIPTADHDPASEVTSR